MNLQKLFEAQAVLDADIEKHHPVQDGEDRLSKKILALLVELGECANEWRGFKFWSNYQGEAVNDTVCEACNGVGFFDYFNPVDGHSTEECENCDGTGFNPLLLEYVDCLHFILSIGNDKKFNHSQTIIRIEKEIHWMKSELDHDIVNNFNFLFRKVGDFTMFKSSGNYVSIFGLFIFLGHILGFTWEQIEQAYYDKNKINHQRQETGY